MVDSVRRRYKTHTSESHMLQDYTASHADLHSQGKSSDPEIHVCVCVRQLRRVHLRSWYGAFRKGTSFPISFQVYTSSQPRSPSISSPPWESHVRCAQSLTGLMTYRARNHTKGFEIICYRKSVKSWFVCDHLRGLRAGRKRYFSLLCANEVNTTGERVLKIQIRCAWNDQYHGVLLWEKSVRHGQSTEPNRHRGLCRQQASSGGKSHWERHIFQWLSLFGFHFKLCCINCFACSC